MASLCGLGMGSVVGTMCGRVCGGARNVNRLRDVVVILQVLCNICVACQAWGSCVIRKAPLNVGYAQRAGVNAMWVVRLNIARRFYATVRVRQQV